MSLAEGPWGAPEEVGFHRCSSMEARGHHTCRTLWMLWNWRDCDGPLLSFLPTTLRTAARTSLRLRRERPPSSARIPVPNGDRLGGRSSSWGPRLLRKTGALSQGCRYGGTGRIRESGVRARGRSGRRPMKRLLRGPSLCDAARLGDPENGIGAQHFRSALRAPPSNLEARWR